MHGNPHREIVKCAGIALINNRRIFLIRPFYNNIAQKYAIPKGHVDKHENASDAAIREFYEETGIDLSGRPLKELVKCYTKISPTKTKMVNVFVVEGDGDEKFEKSIISDSGCPETIYGEYMPFEIAKKFITGYQLPIIEKLLEEDMSSLVGFYNKRTN